MAENHFKQGVENPYLASEDLLLSPGNYGDAILTIKQVVMEKNRFNRKGAGGVAMWKVCYFLEKNLPNGLPAKPFVINAMINLRKLVNGTGKVYINEWAGYQIRVGVETGLPGRVGGKQGLRVLEVLKNQAQKPELPVELYGRAIASYKQVGDFAGVEKHYKITSDIRQALLVEIKGG
jgi:hypothetical protein